MTQNVRLGQIAVSEERSVEGVWAHFEIEVTEGVFIGTCWKVARWGNPNHQERISMTEIDVKELRRRRSGKVKLARSAEEIAEDVGTTVAMDFGVGRATDRDDDYRCPGEEKDRQGRCCFQLTDDDGKPLDHTEANRVMLMLNVPDLLVEISTFAKDLRHFRAERLETAAGESVEPLRGARRTAVK